MPKALIVDDKAENLYLLEVLLKGHGYQVQTAAHGGEALTLARQAPPDIVITDILMPFMDGFALCRHWKQDAALSHIPLVFYTATYTDEKDRQFALSLGADSFIVKPSEPADFIRSITEVLSRKQNGVWPPHTEAPATSEEEYLTKYNQTLIHKLEEKVVALETVNQALTQAEAELRRLNDSLALRVAQRTQALRDAQAQLIDQEKLAALGKLAGSVANELRSPLSVITNAIYFLRLTLPAPTAATRDYLDLLDAEVQTAEHILAELIDYAAPPTTDRHASQVAELTAPALLTLLKPALVEVVTEFPASLPDVLVDAHQIRQALVHLIANAYQAMPEGGQLTLTAQAIGTQVALSVVDTGSGIAAEHMGRLFEPLFTTKLRGIGLGLAVSKKLIEANGGKIEVQSAPGRGSTFTVSLPVAGRRDD